MISRPSELTEHELIASVSGGKDSTAMVLALREAGIPARYVFADTGWEAPETYAHLDLLREQLDITIDVVGAEGGMVGRAEYRAGFPARTQRWCTRELKIKPIRDYHAAREEEMGQPTAVVLGIRADESPARAAMADLDQEAEGPRSWGWYVWRPILAWTVADVLAIHARHGVPLHPFYRLGVDRVGCWPCIFSNKDEMRFLQDHAPERIAEVAAIEERITVERERRNAERPGRYTTPRASFFQGRRGGPLGVAPSIRDVAEWARTSRGGRQLPLVPHPPRGGCFRWGLCDSVPTEERDAS